MFLHDQTLIISFFSANNHWNKQRESYNLHWVVSEVPTDIGNIMVMINKKYQSSTICSTKQYFKIHPPSDISITFALVGITVLIEEKYFVTFVYLNIHQLKGLAKDCLMLALIDYLRFVESLDPNYATMYHMVQGDFNPTIVSARRIANFYTQMRNLGYTKLPEIAAPRKRCLDWTFVKNCRQYVGKECYDIFDTTKSKQHIPVVFKYRP